MKKVKLQVKVKTNLKAGEHCNDAWDDLKKNPSTANMNKFYNCCKRDKECLN